MKERRVESQQALPGAPPPPAAKPLTIGAVCKALAGEFPDLSISKIRYLEEQQLLSPRRTAGGYRLFSQEDVERLRAILRMQRDEFLPLRVIRQELAAGRLEHLPQPKGDRVPSPRSALSLRDGVPYTYPLPALLEELEVEERLVQALLEYGLVAGQEREGVRYLDETEREIVRAAAELARYGAAPRNLRLLRSSAEREAALLHQILAPALRSRNPLRQGQALESLEELVAVTVRLSHLLLVQALRKTTP